ncbi:hypothetical protein [Paenibacillus aceris]|uniref:HEAT repeat domain-containing protein n=1 Tax=Paenibacillus aceris TaxID=869555 RepID=A0ABS4I866_9BACL|nr:hypothetical protein [Paenibacillus aceris]MBP1967129.1 hypothetical protein [Paenibacillus aceris]NHW35538.1 hypothetical protein [Paenibacillus aceris]
MDDNINNLLSSFSWFRPQEEQDKAVQELARYQDEIINILISGTQKDQWHNVIRLVEQSNTEYQYRAVPQMLLLLMDINSPGAKEAVEIMIKLDSVKLKPCIIDVLLRDKKKTTQYG